MRSARLVPILFQRVPDDARPEMRVLRQLVRVLEALVALRVQPRSNYSSSPFLRRRREPSSLGPFPRNSTMLAIPSSCRQDAQHFVTGVRGA